MAAIDIHTGILTSPKFVPLSDGAMRLWLHGLCWSKEHLTDGFIPESMLPTLHKRAARLVRELLTVQVSDKSPLWHRESGGYRIHDYADWQDSAAIVQKRRLTWRAKKHGIRPNSKGESPGESPGDSKGESLRDTPGESREIPLAGSGSGSGSGRGVGGNALSRQPLTAPLVARRRLDLIHESGIGIDVTEAMHRTYVARLANLGDANPDATLRTFYHQTEQAWRGKDTGKAWPFWDARVAELATKRHDPTAKLPFAWTCKHCGEVHRVPRRELFAAFQCAKAVPA